MSDPTQVVPVTARPQKDLFLKIGDDQYQKHVSAVAFSQGNGTVLDWRGGTPDAILTDSVPGAWSASVICVQDWENPDSLCNFLLAHAGEQVPVVYRPHTDGEFSIAAVITLAAPTIGGPVNAFNESTVQCASSAPVPTFPTA